MPRHPSPPLQPESRRRKAPQLKLGLFVAVVNNESDGACAGRVPNAFCLARCLRPPACYRYFVGHDENQIAWSSKDWKKRIFTHYLWRRPIIKHIRCRRLRRRLPPQDIDSLPNFVV
jgi:hypothetical protein